MTSRRSLSCHGPASAHAPAARSLFDAPTPRPAAVVPAPGVPAPRAAVRPAPDLFASAAPSGRDLFGGATGPAQSTLGLDLGRASHAIPRVVQRAFAEYGEAADATHVALFRAAEMAGPDVVRARLAVTLDEVRAHETSIAAGRGELRPGGARAARIRAAILTAAADVLGVTGRSVPRG